MTLRDQTQALHECIGEETTGSQSNIAAPQLVVPDPPELAAGVKDSGWHGRWNPRLPRLQEGR